MLLRPFAVEGGSLPLPLAGEGWGEGGRWRDAAAFALLLYRPCRGEPGLGPAAEFPFLLPQEREPKEGDPGYGAPLRGVPCGARGCKVAAELALFGPAGQTVLKQSSPAPRWARGDLSAAALLGATDGAIPLGSLRIASQVGGMSGDSARCALSPNLSRRREREPAPLRNDRSRQGPVSFACSCGSCSGPPWGR